MNARELQGSFRETGRLLQLALTVAAVIAAWSLFRLPVWSNRTRILVGGVVAATLFFVIAGWVALAASLALRSRLGRLAIPVGAAITLGLCLVVPAQGLDVPEAFQLAGRLAGAPC